ncbi:MAG: DNA polymerase III subunit delta [Commensalibacter sp.]|nr:DNA polymerase III subunit delta [Commensalibacter sp.]MCT6852299.1 DNA polymerase III subunit delta [Commensalibacter sp.]MCT6895483.1 DNA polymerase III subunit delta [Commensalibacter sp.]
MKIDARKITSIFQDINQFRVYLIYGENTGLVRERASRLVKKIANSLNDPFLVAVLDKENHDRLVEEATALSLMGGQRAVWVRDASDNLAKKLEIFCASYLNKENSSHLDSVIVIEAGSLSTRSPLRILAEKHPLMAAIACYAETGRSLEETVHSLLGKKKISPDAFRYLLAMLGGDRILIRNEIEKLLLFVGDEAEITIEAVEQVLGDSNEYSIEDILYAVMTGQTIVADRTLNRGLKEGITLIALIRGLLYLNDRMMQVRIMMEEDGLSLKSAMGKLNPPIFFKRANDFQRAMTYWNKERLLDLARQVQYLELLSKQTAVPGETLCRQFMLMIAQMVKDKKMVMNLKELFSNL